MLMNTEQASKRLGLFTSTVCDLAAKGVIPAHKVGVAWVFDEKKVMTFARRNGLLDKQERKVS